MTFFKSIQEKMNTHGICLPINLDVCHTGSFVASSCIKHVKCHPEFFVSIVEGILRTDYVEAL